MTNSCGICGGGVRMYSDTLHGRPITDWKHTWAPPGIEPHRPVLGRPVDGETLDRLRLLATQRHAQKNAPKTPEPPRPPLVAPRKASSLPPAAVRTQQLALDYGWTVSGHPVYYVSADRVEVVVLAMRRGDLGLMAVWERRPNKNWTYDFGVALAKGHTEQVGSKSLTDWVKQRDEKCSACGRSSLTHDDEECGS